MRFVVETLLKQKYGEELKEWWMKGVPEKIGEDIASRAMKNGEFEDFMPFSYFINLKDIISQRENYDLFTPILDIEGDPHVKKEKRYSWIVKMNSLRNDIFHSRKKSFNSDDADFIEDTAPKFESKFEDFINKNKLEELWKSYYNKY